MEVEFFFGVGRAQGRAVNPQGQRGRARAGVAGDGMSQIYQNLPPTNGKVGAARRLRAPPPACRLRVPPSPQLRTPCARTRACARKRARATENAVAGGGDDDHGRHRCGALAQGGASGVPELRAAVPRGLPLGALGPPRAGNVCPGGR